MDKKVIIGGVSAAAIAGIVLTVVLVNKSGHEPGSSIKVNSGSGILVDKDVITEEKAEDTEDELEIMLDDGVESIMDGKGDQPGGNSNAQAGAPNSGKAQNPSSGASGEKSQPEPQVINPVAPNVNPVVSGGSTTTAGTGTNSSNAASSGNSGSIIEDKNEESAAPGESSYDASEGKSFETERIPVN